jgi:hypothetical protein
MGGPGTQPNAPARRAAEFADPRAGPASPSPRPAPPTRRPLSALPQGFTSAVGLEATPLAGALPRGATRGCLARGSTDWLCRSTVVWVNRRNSGPGERASGSHVAGSSSAPPVPPAHASPRCFSYPADIPVPHAPCPISYCSTTARSCIRQSQSCRSSPSPQCCASRLVFRTLGKARKSFPSST